jgi:hypothetical protein
MQAFPKPEGELFPGLVPILLAAIGLFIWGEPCRARLAGLTRPAPRWLGWLFAALAIGHAVAAVATIIVRRTTIDTGLFVVRIGNINQLLLRAAIAFALLLIVSPAARERTARFMRDRGFFLAGLLAAFWLSLGPIPMSLGRPIELAAPYGFLFEHAPGFDGVRVPARFSMIIALMLAVLGGYGAAALSRWKFGRPAILVLGVAFLFEGTQVPFMLNGVTPPPGFNSPEARVYRPARAPAVYHAMARQEGPAVVAELPLGYPDFDLRAMLYSTVHWKPLVNGYSGFTPPHYGQLNAVLSEIPRHPDISLATLKEFGITHVIIHEAAYIDGEGVATTRVLTQNGAAELTRDGSDVLLQLAR